MGVPAGTNYPRVARGTVAPATAVVMAVEGPEKFVIFLFELGWR
jgi:hypothetical protein